MKFKLLHRLAFAGAAISAFYFVSMLVTGGYVVNLAGLRFEATKLWPAVVAIAAFSLLGLILRCGSLSGALLTRPGAVVFCVAMILFLANGRTISGGDSVPAKNLPLSILRDGNFYLDRLVPPGAKKVPYYLREAGGHYVSDYPVGAALFALPFYAPSIFAKVSPESRVFGELEKISAATIVALSAVLIYLAAAPMAANWMALLIAIVYAAGSSSLSVSSQALWQHGPCQLALAAAIYCLVRARYDPRWAAYAGFPLAMEVITRPADALIAAPLAVFVLFSYRAQIAWFLAGTIPPLAFQLWYNTRYFGIPLRTQYFGAQAAVGGQQVPAAGFWATPLHQGLAILLLSPGRGLFFYSPIFILSLVGLALAWRRGGDVLLRYLGAGVILTIVVAANWHRATGGNSFGPRLLADLAPILAFSLYPLAPLLRDRRPLRVGFAILAAWSIAAHSIGAYFGDRGWNRWALRDPDSRMWLFTDNPVVNPIERFVDASIISARHLPTSRDLPLLLGSEYSLRTQVPISTAPGLPIVVSIRTTNTGRAVWLTGRSDERGTVSLTWIWKKDGVAAGKEAGRRELHRDVFPGDSIDLDASAFAPETPGDYTLEISLSAEGAAQFGDPPAPPIEVSVKVLP
ncbi:MAG TPA: hypothetical protein VEU51_09485 [Candidatus Acidoferrales bacterium]|nr:hypothetical protein [Candidatus Acidoferrales bacterium]